MPARREQLALCLILVLLTVAAWGLTAVQMRGMATMSAAPGKSADQAMAGMAMRGSGETVEPGIQLLVFLSLWLTMMAAMMLPSAMPMILLFRTIARGQQAQGRAFVPTWVFVAGYLGAWTAIGAYAWGLGLLGGVLSRAWPALGSLGPWLAALALFAAALYQLTPLKHRCLAHCRSPLHFVLGHWRAGPAGALRMGWEHGFYCIGCCWVLMVVLVTVGLSSLPWMGLITLLIFAEKLLPWEKVVSRGIAGLLLVLGILVLVRPELLVPAMG